MAFKDGFKKFMGMDSEEEYDEDDVMEPAEEDNQQVEYDFDRSYAAPETPSYAAHDDFGLNEKHDEYEGEMKMNQSVMPQVVLVKPEKFEDASSIADHLQAKRTVIVNTDAVTPEIRRRLVDFLSGVAYADNAIIKKASSTTFVMTPDTVGLVGEGEGLADEAEPVSHEQDVPGANEVYY